MLPWKYCAQRVLSRVVNVMYKIARNCEFHEFRVTLISVETTSCLLKLSGQPVQHVTLNLSNTKQRCQHYQLCIFRENKNTYTYVNLYNLDLKLSF